ncbi:MaoC family dehydratase [Halomonas shantousis]
MKIVKDINELKDFIGTEMGVSDWVEITQERIQRFADATDDHQWIHIDVERARRESPMGAPIAHGFLTLSMLPQLGQGLFDVQGVKARINYGLNKVRFPAPVPAGSRIRLRLKLKSVEPSGENRFLVCNEATIELEGSERPACVAESLTLYLTS